MKTKADFKDSNLVFKMLQILQETGKVRETGFKNR
jgi:hypothetical protein